MFNKHKASLVNLDKKYFADQPNGESTIPGGNTSIIIHNIDFINARLPRHVF